jgi:hypothetical protein
MSVSYDRSTKIKLPKVRVPSLTTRRKNPRGWSQEPLTLRERGLPQATRFTREEPAGDPPPSWPGTRPEWAIFWALTAMGRSPGVDFEYIARTPGAYQSYYSTVDFLLIPENIGIEVQGLFWHYGQGNDKILKDAFRQANFQAGGIKVIYIDEDHAQADPLYYVREALAGRDHSRANRSGL